MGSERLGIRWTIGQVSDAGFEALLLSVWGAHKIFGDRADYTICVNTVGLAEARRRTGPLPADVAWHDASCEFPAFLAAHFDPGKAAGVAWKLAPLRVFPGQPELSLDNDCILWERPAAIDRWLASPRPRGLLAEDVRVCSGCFASDCGPEPRHSGIRGLPPALDLEEALREAIRRRERRQGRHLVLRSELDEQGLETAALTLRGTPEAVSLDEVSVCSPFFPHRHDLGSCGAHFVGLNARHRAWSYYDRPADVWMADHWHRHRETLYELTGAPPA